jgi:hypothetical protein
MMLMILIRLATLIMLATLTIPTTALVEQFGVTSGVLNCELPLATRWHAIQVPRVQCLECCAYRVPIECLECCA